MTRRLWALVIAATLASSPPGAAPAGAAPSRITAVTSPGAKMWSNPATWGGRLPAAGDRVTIPTGASVVLDVSPPPLKGIYVNGTLTFAEKDLELTSDWIMVHGTLAIGSTATPFRHKAVITLTSGVRTVNIMDMGTKAIGVMGGTLELHGRRIAGWTRLNASAPAGAKRITLAKPLNWRVGDEIVIASSDYWRTHDEERTISAIDGTTLQFEEPLKYPHYGEVQTYEGRVLDERAEVGLLTRNIVIRGDAASTRDGFGGHTMIMAGGHARIEGVEFAHMGQKNALARYPVHFHMDGNAPDSYLRNSSIHHSFNRCVTVHGTNQLRLNGNVCFEHLGHGFFMEDGAETDNVFVNNLGLGTIRNPDGLLRTDRDPATFWITNPDNTFRNNVAAGSDGSGFWYALSEHPTGLSEHGEIWPRRIPLKEFSGNVAHSNGDRGLNVDSGLRPDGRVESTWYRPVENPADEDSGPVVARFENLTAYMNRDRGVWLRGSHHVITGAVLADNRNGATFASQETFLEDSLVVGESANKGTPEPWEEAGINGHALPFFWEPEAQITGFEFYDGRVGVRNTTFVNFVGNSQRPAGALSYLHEDAFGIHPKNFSESSTFVNSTAVYMSDPAAGMDGDASKVFVDRDGSVTGTPSRAVVVNNPFLLDASCEFKPEWNTHVCATEYTTLMVGSEGGPAPIKPVKLYRPDGIAQTLMGCCDDSDDAWTSVMPGRSYAVEFNGAIPATTRYVLRRSGATTSWVQLAIPAGPTVEVTRWGYRLPVRWSLEALDSSTESAYYYDSANSRLHLKLSGERSDWEEVVVKQ